MIAEKSPKSIPRQNRPLKRPPRSLVYEIINGQPVYYKGYQEVMAGSKKLEDIMGASALQAVIISYILQILFRFLDEKKYLILTNEPGLHLNKRNNLSGDILIYDRSIFSVKTADKHYLLLPPKIQIEVDTNADLKHFGTMENYLTLKTQKLLDFGVEKVIWILSEEKKVLIALQKEDWLMIDWHKSVEILDGFSFNVGQYLKDEGSEFA
ncbi:MAG: Uma2 family endonuclease [Runella sp.]